MEKLTLMVIVLFYAITSALFAAPFFTQTLCPQNMQLEQIDNLSWHPDENKLAVTVWPNIQIWDMETNQNILTITDAYPYSIAWHPDGEQIATVIGGNAETLLIWDAVTGELLEEHERPMNTNLNTVVVADTAWSPTGEYIASATHGGEVVIWNLNTVSFRVLSLPELAQEHGVDQIVWNSTGDKIITGDSDLTIRMWDVVTEENILTVPGYRHVAWSPDNTSFAGASLDNRVAIWNAESGALLTQSRPHQDTITSISWNADNNIASSSVSGEVWLWNPSEQHYVDLTNADSWYDGLDWNSRGDILAARYQGNLVLWCLS